MPNLGPVELIVVAAVLLALILVIVVVGVRAADRGSGKGGVVPVPPPTPQGLDEIVTTLARRERRIHAIKALRQHTGLGLAESKAVVDAVAAGHDLWSHPLMARFRPSHPTVPPSPGATGPDLATRVRGLKAAGRAEQAVHLVRGETGMGEREAVLFVESL